ncbi:MAG: response regulator [Chloroflexota bacterium]
MPARILIIDDEPNWTDFAAANLKAAFEVELAGTLEAALLKLQQNYYELVIVGFNRYDVLRIIKEQYPKNRLIVATGQESVREAINVFRLGVLDYFRKDFQGSGMSQKILSALQKPSIVTPA